MLSQPSAGSGLTVDTVDALHRPLKARYAITDSGLAVMEMASASGFELIADKDRVTSCNLRPTGRAS